MVIMDPTYFKITCADLMQNFHKTFRVYEKFTFRKNTKVSKLMAPQKVCHRIMRSN